MGLKGISGDEDGVIEGFTERGLCRRKSGYYVVSGPECDVRSSCGARTKV